MYSTHQTHQAPMHEAVVPYTAPINPAMMGIISQLVGANPQAIVAQMMPMIAPYLAPHIDTMIRDRMTHHGAPMGFKSDKSGVDLLMEFTDELIPTPLQSKIMEDPYKFHKMKQTHKHEIDAMAKKLMELFHI